MIPGAVFRVILQQVQDERNGGLTVACQYTAKYPAAKDDARRYFPLILNLLKDGQVVPGNPFRMAPQQVQDERISPTGTSA